MEYLKEYIDYLLSLGKPFFTKQEALSLLKLNETQYKFQIYRLSQKNVIKRIFKDFYIIITPEYLSQGSLPAHWFIDALMKYRDQEYYIGLLSAAALYGATNQQPMVFQVITDKPTRDIAVGNMRIQFHVFKNCGLAGKVSKEILSVPTGYVNISSKPQTMVDLIRFYQVCGFLDNVASIIKTLAEENDFEEWSLQAVLKNEPTDAVLQRLGYIFELLRLSHFAKMVGDELSKRNIQYIRLKPEAPNKTGQQIQRWKLILNDTLDIE